VHTRDQGFQKNDLVRVENCDMEIIVPVGNPTKWEKNEHTNCNIRITTKTQSNFEMSSKGM
jgi:hypothetical protein